MNSLHIIFNPYLRYGQLITTSDPTVGPYKKVLPKSVRDLFISYLSYGGVKFKRGDNWILFPLKGFLCIEETDDDETGAPNKHSLFHLQNMGRMPVWILFYCTTRRCLALFLWRDWRDDVFSEGFMAGKFVAHQSRSCYLPDESVEHVANILLGGDVRGLESDTHGALFKFKSKTLETQGVLRLRILYTDARDLPTFSLRGEILYCRCCCCWRYLLFRSILFLENLAVLMISLPSAAHKAYKIGILHRDLSAGNIKDK